jgi:OmpA-OmpF porin, OOP family
MKSKYEIISSHALILALGFTAFSALTLAGCASTVKKAEISASANTNDEVASLTTDIQTGYGAQLDVLAPKEFTAAQKGLERVNDQMKDGAKQEKLVNSLAIARGNLNKANDLANGRRALVQGVLDARNSALTAGARQYPQVDQQMKLVDDDLRSQTGRTSVSPTDFADMQKRYLDLELSAIKEKKLGSARAAVAQAKNNGAKKNTPKTLNKAETALTNAENQIASNRNNESNFAAAVTDANAGAALLVATLAATKRPDGQVASEEVALNLVAQNRKIHGLDGQLVDAANDSAEKDRAYDAQGKAMDAQGKELATANAAISIDQALERGRKQFTKDEAEVFRQGSKLLIRLKAIQFATGKSDLPSSSLELLAKVRNVASALNPSAVEVQGHTDSVGNQGANQTLSQNRAEAVATYLGSNGLATEKVAAVGYGFSKPLSTNKTKHGRAQNRRVDVLITPTSI